MIHAARHSRYSISALQNMNAHIAHHFHNCSGQSSFMIWACRALPMMKADCNFGGTTRCQSLLVLLALCCLANISTFAQSPSRTVHVFVVLADNQNQGIV